MIDTQMQNTDSEKFVLLAGELVKKRDVPLGKEFVEDGRKFQTSLGSPCYFSLVLHGARYKHGDKWFIKTYEMGGHAVATNSPFGAKWGSPHDLHHTQKVRILEITDRGPA